MLVFREGGYPEYSSLRMIPDDFGNDLQSYFNADGLNKIFRQSL